MLEVVPLQEVVDVGPLGGLDWLSEWDGEAWATAVAYGVYKVTDWAKYHEAQETTRTEIRESEDWPPE